MNKIQMIRLSQRCWAIAFLSLLGIAFIHPRAFATSLNEGQLLSEAKAVRYSSVDIAKLEPNALRSSRGRVVRYGDKLELHLSDGAKKIFINEKDCPRVANRGGACRYYYLIAFVPSRHLFLIYLGRYEGGQYLAVDENSGMVSKFDDFPDLSPDGSRILICKNSDQSDSEGVEIWRRYGSRFKLEWSGSPSASGSNTRTYYHLARWLSEQEIDLRSETFVGSTSEPIISYVRFYVNDSSWEVRVEGLNR